MERFIGENFKIIWLIMALLTTFFWNVFIRGTK